VGTGGRGGTPESIDVAGFILDHYTPYDGDASCWRDQRTTKARLSACAVSHAQICAVPCAVILGARGCAKHHKHGIRRGTHQQGLGGSS